MWHPVKELPPIGKTDAVPPQYLGRGDLSVEMVKSHDTSVLLVGMLLPKATMNCRYS